MDVVQAVQMDAEAIVRAVVPTRVLEDVGHRRAQALAIPAVLGHVLASALVAAVDALGNVTDVLEIVMAVLATVQAIVPVADRPAPDAGLDVPAVRLARDAEVAPDVEVVALVHVEAVAVTVLVQVLAAGAVEIARADVMALAILVAQETAKGAVQENAQVDVLIAVLDAEEIAVLLAVQDAVGAAIVLAVIAVVRTVVQVALGALLRAEQDAPDVAEIAHPVVLIRAKPLVPALVLERVRVDVMEWLRQ